jgi:phage host-nuclease inhibitor protein Gam
MIKQKSTPEYVTREILKEEISASEMHLTAKIGDEIRGVEERLTAKIGDEVSGVEGRLGAKITGLDVKVDLIEKRLDARIETTAQSLKEYTDSRFTQLDGKIADVDIKVKGLDAKLTKYFELMMQTFTNANKGINKILSNHEKRITVLEARGPQASRI